MPTIPSNIARVPNILASQLMLGSLTRSSLDLLDMQVKLSSGKRINNPSDDPLGTSTVSVLDDLLERRDQRLRNFSHAESVLNNVDAALGDVGDIMIEAKSVAASQIGVGSDEETRRTEARVIDAMLAEIVNIANRKYQQIHYFGGSATASPPIQSLLGGLQYIGEGDGMLTDLGQSRPLPITVSGEDAFGALSARVQGTVDLDPIMLPDTLISDLNGARGLDVSLGTIDVNVGGTPVPVDLTGASTVQDVIDAINTAIDSVEPGGPPFIRIDPVTNNRFEIIGTTMPVTISDPISDATAADLGLNATFPPGGGTGADVDPRLAESTLVSSLSLPGPLGMIRLQNMGQTRDLDLSTALTIEDIQNAVEGLDIGIRVEIADSRKGLNFINELSGGTMAVAEVAGGTTATDLGVRSFAIDTELADFNDGLGVQIRSGSVDPITGLPDPAKDLDFRITVRDARTFDVDLAGAVTVDDVLTMVNAAAAAAGITPPEFTARLADDGNGIQFDDTTLPAGNETIVEALNGSYAATDLGILGSSGAGANLVGEDRATVAVDSVFTHLIALRDALETNDERGITLAGEKLEQDLARATETRAAVGVRTRRVTDATEREEDLRIQDTALKSQIQDLDFTEAALRFSLLQQQLQAGLATAGQISTLSLLDFLR